MKNETHKPPNDDFRFSPQNKISIDPKNHIDSNVKQRFISKYSINTNQLDEKTGNLHGIPKHKMIIYPNPTGDLVSLQIEKVDEVDLTYQILDLSGNLVTKRKLNQTKEIQIGHLPAGSYILNVKRKSESNQFVS
ncbi:MAG: T9SS type A sorting domain-containing protein [Saprospiraceae bacterium]|nr:T9SS type A sorting domain-containing protein [Saprospiraceae bacterium]